MRRNILQSVLKQENTLPDGCFSENGKLTMNGSFINLPQQNMIPNGIYFVMLVLKTGNRQERKGIELLFRFPISI